MHVRSPCLTLDPIRPGLHLLRTEGVVEAEHPLAVIDGRELRRERATHLLGRTLRRPQTGVPLLDLLQLTQQLIEPGVGHDRRIPDVVGELMTADLLGQLGPSVPHIGRNLPCI